MGDISTGASNDIERATKIAHSMVTKYGMSNKLGPIAFGSDNNEVFIGRDMGHVKNYSEKTAYEIDAEVKEIIQVGYSRTEEILKNHMDKLEKVAQFLFKNEKMSGGQFKDIMEDKVPRSFEDDDDDFESKNDKNKDEEIKD